MNIFGGNTGYSYDDIQRHRKVAEQLRGARPRNVGEGVVSIANALLSRAIEKKADRRESALKDRFNEACKGATGQSGAMADLYNNPMASDAHKKILGALMKQGVPGYARGGKTKKDGLAIVGEAGPEVIYAPEGTEIEPLDLMDDAQNPGPAWWLDTRFDDGKSYQTADMSAIEPSGVGERNDLHAAARSYQGFMKSLSDYERTFKDPDGNPETKDGGSTMWPGKRKDELGIAHRDLQMQMKELYNLGVLNGPDLDLMNQILIDPTSVAGNVMDALGIADMEERIPANIAQVRQLMKNRTEPALQQLGIDPETLMPKQKAVGDLSDEELLKMLGGS